MIMPPILMLAPARAGAGEHLLGGARHVVLQPEEDRLAGRHLRAPAMRGAERLQHPDHRRLEHLVDRLAHRSLKGRFVARRMHVRVRGAERLQRAVVHAAFQAVDGAGAEEVDVVHLEERAPGTLERAGAAALARAPEGIGELADHAHTLVAHAREAERRAEHLAELVAHRRAVSEAGREDEMHAEKAQLAAQRVAACVHARALQPLEQLVPARRRAEHQHAFVEPQPLGDEIDERVKEAVFLLVEVQHVRHAAHASAARFTALSRRLSPNLYRPNLYRRNGKPRRRYWIISQPPLLPPAMAEWATPAAGWGKARERHSAAKPKTK